MTILFCEKGGLMEDPAFHWEVIGEADGSTAKEVADNLALKDAIFAKDYNPERVTYWGWRLSIDTDGTAQQGVQADGAYCEGHNGILFFMDGVCGKCGLPEAPHN